MTRQSSIQRYPIQKSIQPPISSIESAINFFRLSASNFPQENFLKKEPRSCLQLPRPKIFEKGSTVQWTSRRKLWKNKITKQKCAKTSNSKVPAIMARFVDSHTENTNSGTKLLRVFSTKQSPAFNGCKKITVHMDTGVSICTNPPIPVQPQGIGWKKFWKN